jgi:UDP-3-O-[3-hydroxymyristoyl] glucosamine N-acyltransferase
MSAQGQNCAKRADEKTSNEVMCSKLSAVIATANFQQKEPNKKNLLIFKRNCKRKGLAKL